MTRPREASWLVVALIAASAGARLIPGFPDAIANAGVVAALLVATHEAGRIAGHRGVPAARAVSRPALTAAAALLLCGVAAGGSRLDWLLRAVLVGLAAVGGAANSGAALGLFERVSDAQRGAPGRLASGWTDQSWYALAGSLGAAGALLFPVGEFARVVWLVSAAGMLLLGMRRRPRTAA